MKVTSFFGVAALVLACNAAEASEQADNARRPNILFFITDDESWLERSVYGWSKLPTPHLDRVARDGVLFEHAYTSVPSCAPSRAVCVTGRNFWELEQGAFIQAWLPKTFPVLPELLAAAGYHVGYTGKGWGPGVYPPQGHRWPIGPPYNDVKMPQPVKWIRDIDYAANFEAFLEGRNANEPFYFWLGTGEPHSPYDGENYKRLEKEYGMAIDDIPMPDFLEDTPENRRERGNFLYECCYADAQLGKALALLESTGELRNTLVFVTSDNGTAVADRGKASPYDWSCREPLAIMWPQQVPAGRKVTDFVSFRDFAPTILDAAGLDIPESMTGRSLLPILCSAQSGRVQKDRDFIVHGLEWHGEFDPVSRSHRTYRNDRFAYIVRYDNTLPPGKAEPTNAEVTAEELYDMRADPWQRQNLVANPKYAKVVADLKRKLRTYALETGDPRFTGDMQIFLQTRKYVQRRKDNGYPTWTELPWK